MAPVYLDPTQDVASIVTASPAGTTFIFASGVYKNVKITPRNNDSFIGRNGVTLTGSIPITGWRKSGSYWTASGFPVNGFTGPGVGSPSRGILATIPEDLYVNGTPYLRVGSLSALGAGDFYTSGNGRVYISDTPTGKTTTASNHYYAFDGDNTTGITVQNMTVEQYASYGNNGAVEANGSSGWNVVNVNAIDNHAGGLSAGNNMTITGGNYSNNGQIGIQDYMGSNVVINGVTANNNNWAGFDPGWDAGGIKILLANGVTVENSTISNNYGNGLWFDTDNQNVSVVNNTISNNQLVGLLYEASFSANISGNTLSCNAQSGDTTAYWGSDLLLLDSQKVTVTNNLVIVNSGAQGIGMLDDTRGPGPSGLQPAAEYNTIEQNTLIYLGSGQSGGGSDGDPSSQMFKGTNVWDNNTYVAKNANDVAFTWNNTWYTAARVDDSPIEKKAAFIYRADPSAAVPGTPPAASAVAASPAIPREQPEDR